MKKIIEEEIKKFINRHRYDNGSEVDDVDIDEIVEMVYSDLMNTSADVPFKWEYCGENDIDEDDFDDQNMEESDDYKEFVKYELMYIVENAVRNITDEFNGDGTITVARVMTVEPRWLEMLPKKRLHLGIYWSWDHSAAEAHWAESDRKITVKMYAVVQTKYIDWEQTLMANGHIHLGDMEREITLHKNTPIKLVGLEVDDEEMDLDEMGISDKT